MHCGSDFYHAEHIAIMFSFPFCCGLACLCAAFIGIQIYGLHALEDFVVAFCNSIDSADVVRCLQCRCLMHSLN